MRLTERGEVSLDVSLDPGPAVTLHFAVRDTGIDPAIRQRILGAPAPADGSPRPTGGAGLGLILAAKLVEMMQGRIWVENVPGGGSACHFTGRFEAVADPPSEPAAGSIQPSRADP